MRLHPLAARALLAAGVATFVLPSCFTVAVWRNAAPTPQHEPRAVVAGGLLVAAASDGSVTALAVGLGADAGPTGREATDGWLCLHDFDRPRLLATFVRLAHDGRLHDVRLAIVLPEPHPVAPFRDRASLSLCGWCDSDAAAAELGDDGRFVRTEILCYFEMRRELEPRPPPWPDAASEVAQQVRSTSVGRVARAVALTPFSAACDVITSPIQLVGFLLLFGHT